jgi:hypothetical protein
MISKFASVHNKYLRKDLIVQDDGLEKKKNTSGESIL